MPVLHQVTTILFTLRVKMFHALTNKLHIKIACCTTVEFIDLLWSTLEMRIVLYKLNESMLQPFKNKERKKETNYESKSKERLVSQLCLKTNQGTEWTWAQAGNPKVRMRGMLQFQVVNIHDGMTCNLQSFDNRTMKEDCTLISIRAEGNTQFQFLSHTAVLLL